MQRDIVPPASNDRGAALKFLHSFLAFLFHLGYFGPLLMGILDSSFLFLPFGNDLLVVGLVANKHGHNWIYVLSAALGSTIGAFVLTLLARKLGAEGICKLAGQKQFDRLKRWIGDRAAIAIACGALAPPPFPYTLVIAAAGALDYPIWRILITNFIARAVRFSILAWLAMRFGKEVMKVAESGPFRWTMIAIIVICFLGSGYSIWHWYRKTRSKKSAK